MKKINYNPHLCQQTGAEKKVANWQREKSAHRNRASQPKKNR
jgi:hypothetical protein